MRLGKQKVFFENRNVVERGLQQLDEKLCQPLCRHFGLRCSFLAEHHCQAKKPGVTVRDPLLYRKQVGKNPEDVVEELRYLSTIRLRVRKKSSASELLPSRTVMCVLLHEMAHLRHMNHGRKFMLLLRELFARAASLGLISPETKEDRNEIPSPWAWENEIQRTAGACAEEQLAALFSLQRKVDKIKKAKLAGKDAEESDEEDEIIVKAVKVKDVEAEEAATRPDDPGAGAEVAVAPAESAPLATPVPERTPRPPPSGSPKAPRPSTPRTPCAQPTAVPSC